MRLEGIESKERMQETKKLLGLETEAGMRWQEDQEPQSPHP